MKKRILIIAGVVLLILAILGGILLAVGVFEDETEEPQKKNRKPVSQPVEDPENPPVNSEYTTLLNCLKNEDFTTDTDGDGLPDFYELARTDTDFTLVDTDGNGLNDGEEDPDGDGLVNSMELEYDTSPTSADTDGDGLRDGEERQTYGTDPLVKDTDQDGAADGWEVEQGTDPLRHNDYFNVSVECVGEGVTAKVEVSAEAVAAQSVTVTPVKRNSLINETIPGYMGSAFQVSAQGNMGIAKISFEFKEARSNLQDRTPTIYCLNEQTQMWIELDTTVTGNTATARSALFSTYILLDKKEYDEYESYRYQIEPPADTQTDSNQDGIPDYMTKWMCDGIIRTGTGALIFDGYSYEEVQASDDLDGDGLKNGDEITVDHIIGIPEDAIQWVNGHYYKRFDEGHNWLDVVHYCKGMGGYLVTITSSDEQDFVQSLLQDGGKSCYWIGASDQDEEGYWRWVSGEPWEYENWHWGEPNNAQAGEHYAEIQTWTDYSWNDGEREGDTGEYSQDNHGYICEWDVDYVEERTIIFLKSSPISTDTDRDGFGDAEDPTPNDPEVFATMTSYKKFYYDDEIIVTIFAKQPVWDNRRCMSFTGEEGWVPYYVAGGTGHCYLGIDDVDEAKDYFGFYGNGGEVSALAIALLREEAPGNLYGELTNAADGSTNNQTVGEPIFTVAKSFVITQEQKEQILAYREENGNHKYSIASYNCTTFAVEALNECGLDVDIYEHNWSHDEQTVRMCLGDEYFETTIRGSSVLDVIMYTYYGYSPADTAQDIKENYGEYLVCRSYTLTDGTAVIGYELVGR